MKRIPFSQVLKNASLDIYKEYTRLYELFYLQHFIHTYTIYKCCGDCFKYFPFRGTCISLKDFDESYNLSFSEFPDDFDLNYLVNFCEYSYNLTMHTKIQYDHYAYAFDEYMQQVLKVIDLINYMPNKSDDGITDFVPKDAAVVSVAEIVKPDLSYRIIEYNHHSMKGDLEGKRNTLLILANQLEPKRTQLRQINSAMESDIFFLFNNVKLRHNNSDPTMGSYYHQCIAEMGLEQLEQWYDETYQLCLLAFLELDNLERKDRISQLKAQL